MGKILDCIESPRDLRSLTTDELNVLCREIRQEIIRTVAKNGGHLASNLGVVELTVALHYVFDVPFDHIVWDVGHQSYTHKILTGRKDQLHTIRTQGGLSGYPNPKESDCDPFHAGHSSTSISVALGLASAKNLHNDPGHVVAVIGDGALTGGLAYEGLNNAGRFPKNFIVILNDNKMSISKNVGSIARYLAHIRTQPGYLKAKGTVAGILDHLPVLGDPISNVLEKSKTLLKQALYKGTLFEDMGFAYYGPYDGHDVEQLISVLQSAKEINRPVLLHVITAKGKGYSFAEKNPDAFHGVPCFDIKTGESQASGENFSKVFGKCLCAMAKKDDRLCAITAAMESGTGLAGFHKAFPDRFFDVGIAEEHAVTFAGGLAAGGMLPVFAVYSSFLQRSIDQVIHDAALQNLKVTLAIDRAGVVGEDGETHQGLFDVSLLSAIPNMTIFSPAYHAELELFLHQAIYECPGVTAVRYPRGGQLYQPEDFTVSGHSFDEYGDRESPVALVTYGRLFSMACLAAKKLRQEGVPVRIIKLNRIHPVDPQAVEACMGAQHTFFFEEGIRQGGVGEHFLYLMYQKNYAGKTTLQAVENRFVKQATMRQSLAELQLDSESMKNSIQTEYQK
ncbi:1-deoxy-D-xylulose-5-phosphate synthase [Faecalispora anaeroviscerum]|uniref:1-deoxy-D-xylulose-5-phosphate synthase n=1 Tax=Faecalispora anaeroviscerum TaxID=2991836 RepID=UPI0024B90DC4|nr:1-deoxy-D-xylulose-5-phosphate synthase [Faecalispora anaeroviscerum]